jgi:2-keto-4-pentenoate hydratase
VLGAGRYSLQDIDFKQVSGHVVVNDGEESAGPTTSIMGQDPLAGLLWAANELPKWGMHLRAGDFVFSGTVCPPLEVRAGDSATVSFTNLGSLSVDLIE